jgi:hypothetical protein
MRIFPQQWRAEFGVLPQGDTEGQVEPSKPLDLVDGQHGIQEQTRPRAKVDAKGWGCPVDAARPTIPPARGALVRVAHRSLLLGLACVPEHWQ